MGSRLNARARRGLLERALSAAMSGWALAVCSLVACSSERQVVEHEAASDEDAQPTKREDAASSAGAHAAGMDASTDASSEVAGSPASGSGGAGGSHTAGRSGSAGSGMPPAAAGSDAMEDPGETSEPNSPMPAAGAGGASAMLPPPMRSTEPAQPDEIIVPEETADEDALERLRSWNELPLFRSERYEQQSSHDRGQANDAEEMLLPILGHDNRDMNNFLCKSADADAATVLIGYHYDLETCPESYARGVVMARYEGSGRLTRFWITVSSLAQAGGALSKEMFRIYIDDNPRPLVQARLADVMSGSAGEIFAPPFGAASDAFVAWYYPVVFGSKLIVTLDHLSADYYFQTDALLDRETKPRFAAGSRLPARDAAKQQLMAASPAAGAGAIGKEAFSLAKDQMRAVTTRGPATVQELRLKVARDKLATLAAVRLAVRWNGADSPAIDLPLLDLFAARRAVVAKSNLALAASTEGDVQVLSLRLPMPFEASAEWTLHQTGDATAEFELEWLGVKEAPATEYGHLHVQQRELALPAMEIDQPVAEASGRGRYVGMCTDLEGKPDNSLGIFGTAPLNFLEGDVRAMVDGKRALDGTGTEDYPDNSFYFRDTPKATPFAQNWNLIDSASSSPAGAVSFCRWQVFGNEVDFQSELRLTREIGIGDPSIALLSRTIAYLYQP
jgi:Protein of unknown function (DUF2961)